MGWEEVAAEFCAEELQEMVETDCFSVLYQPVVSIKANRIVGFEALARGRRKDESLLLPESLFGCGIPSDLRLAADRACRRHALKAFKRFSKQQPDLLLFLNLDPSQVQRSEVELGYTLGLAQELDVPGESICLELPATDLSFERLEDFLFFYREHGFKFSIDHVGCQEDFISLLSRYEPDFMKLDREFHASGDSGGHAPARLGLLSEFAARMGCHVIMLGIEQQEEAECMACQGMHLQQGFFYTKEKIECAEGAGENATAQFLGRINQVHKLMKDKALQHVQERKESFKKCHRLAGKLVYELNGVRPSGFDAVLGGFLVSHQDVVSAFVLDEHGMQITERYHQSREGRTLSAVDKAESAKGGDHSLQDYFIHLATGYERFVTAPFVSAYTGERSRLVCHCLFEGPTRMYMVCVELPDVR